MTLSCTKFPFIRAKLPIYAVQIVARRTEKRKIPWMSALQKRCVENFDFPLLFHPMGCGYFQC